MVDTSLESDQLKRLEYELQAWRQAHPNTRYCRARGCLVTETVESVGLPSGDKLRSLRSLQLSQLTQLLTDVGTGLNAEQMGGYLGGRTAEYAYQERDRWEQDPTVENRKACADRTAMEIRAEIAILHAITDEAYENATRELPLETWGKMSTRELVHYARGRGVEPGEWFEGFKGFGGGHAGMAGYCWYRLGTKDEVSLAERERIFGLHMAVESAREAAKVSGAYTGRID